MNGRLSVESISVLLARKSNMLADNFSANTDFTVSEIRDMMNALTADMVVAANLNPHSMATELLTNGGEEGDKGLRHDAAWWVTHKIHAIKQIRSVTGCGLKEAKEAFEQMLPTYYKHIAEKALRDLEVVNRTAGYRFAEYVSKDVHPSVIVNSAEYSD